MRPISGELTVSDTEEIQPDGGLNCCLRRHGGTVFPVMSARIPSVVLAHQGGWDEILWVMIPITAMIGLLRVATKRVREQKSDSGDIGTE